MTTNKLVRIQSSTGSQGPNGVSIINISGANTYLKTCSAYLHIRVKITVAGDVANALTIDYGNAIKSASSLINKLVINSNGVQLENLLAYGMVLNPSLVAHASNSGFYEKDFKQAEKLHHNNDSEAKDADNVGTVCID